MASGLGPMACDHFGYKDTSGRFWMLRPFLSIRDCPTGRRVTMHRTKPAWHHATVGTMQR